MTDRSDALHRRTHSGDRLRYLTDGVFAIVMTLLVLELRVPEASDQDLSRAILHTLPKIAVYLLTVAVLGGMWFRNRTESEFVSNINHVYNWLTFAWLAIVALLRGPRASCRNTPILRSRWRHSRPTHWSPPRCNS